MILVRARHANGAKSTWQFIPARPEDDVQTAREQTAAAILEEDKAPARCVLALVPKN